jgi:3-(methylthio)propionyl---CoA ligase
MHGLMMKWPLLVSSLLQHAERNHGNREIVSRRVEGDLHRYNYRELAARARRVASALRGCGLVAGDRVGTLAWNGHRHMELYFGVSGQGAVIHTINPRLHADQMVWIANHAEDRLLFFDLSFLPQVEAIAARTPSIRQYIAMTDRAHMPTTRLPVPLLCYEEWLEGVSDEFDWPLLEEETAAALCYTSGTTGHPKGVLYSHRSTVLHSYAGALPDSLNCSECDTILPVVPMFHANAWGLPYIGCLVGAKLVFPGPHLDGKSLFELFEAEKVTLSAGVPTVWQGLLAYMEHSGSRFSTMRRSLIGGSACPSSIIQTFEDRYGVQVLHGWGMTELSPIGTISALKARHLDLPRAEQLAVKGRQGRALFGIEMKVIGPDGRELPRDGKVSGELLMRGSWVAASYFRGDNHSQLIDGWFPTGDVSTIDADGYMQITDRSKDVIKSGGEWISSIDLENIAMAHPGVTMAACIAIAHPKWDERPLLVVVGKTGVAPTRDELLRYFDGKVAKWWVPDDVVFVDSIPIGATGKMQKNKLREQFADYRLPG